ncbi:MAG: hypothetical protein AAGH40_02430 [Verrucomicrobiota bacterium]
MKIEIEYLALDESTPVILELKPDDFYDPVALGENYWEHGIERLVFPYEHIQKEPSQLKWLILREQNEEMVRLHRIQFLDGEKSMMQHTVDEHGEEKIIYSCTQGDESHIHRFIKPAKEMWTTTQNQRASDKKTGEGYKTENLTKNWSHSDLLSFAKSK